jgi:hypothetical protein
MEAICTVLERIKAWWYPPKCPQVHVVRGRSDSTPLLDAREVVHDKVPSLKDLEKIIYFYKPKKF